MADHVINGEGKILGRLATHVAKLTLNGDQVIVVNAEKIVISGHLKFLVAKYKAHVERKDKANPEHSPYISRRPDLFVKRVIRGMLPYRQPRGKAAFDRLKVYMGVPEGVKVPAKDTLHLKDGRDVYENLITIKELAGKLGYV